MLFTPAEMIESGTEKRQILTTLAKSSFHTNKIVAVHLVPDFISFLNLSYHVIFCPKNGGDVLM
jgi:hypothetical protein